LVQVGGAARVAAVRWELVRPVAERQVAAGGERVDQLRDRRVRRFVVGDEVQYGNQQQRGGLAQVEQAAYGGVAEYLARLAYIAADRGGVGVTGEQFEAFADGDRVDVHVDDPGVGRDPLGDLVHVALGRDTGADVQELPDADAGE